MPMAAKALGMTAKEAGSYMTAFYAGYVLTQLPGGWLTDRIGYRKVLLGSFFVMGFFTILMGTVQSFQQGLVYRIFAGIGSGEVFSACIRAIFEWFPGKGRGTAVGFFMTASSLGVTVVNLFIPTIAKGYGWNASFYAAGVLPLIVLLFAYFILKERTGSTERKQLRVVSNFWIDMKVLLSNRNLMLTAFAGFCAMWATWGTATWANTYMNKALNLSLVQAGFIMSIYGGAALLCKPIAGILTDLFGGKKRMLLFWMLAAFGPLLLLFGTNTSMVLLYIIAPLLGIAAFIYSPVMSIYIGELVELRLVGSATGLVNAIWQLGSLFAPLVVGIVLDATQNYAYAFATLAAGPVIGSLIILAVQEKKSDKSQRLFA
jgi:sugar phosphate permease